jgi:Ca2+-binding RTX toxin-like protein
LSATGNDVRLYGRGGNDRLQADSRFSMLEGDEGNDTLIGSRGYDNLFGGAGDDLLDDRLDSTPASFGSGGANFAGGAGNDTIFGGAADDLIQLGAYPDYGNDAIDGGGGGDSITFENSTSSVVVHLAAGTASVGTTGSATLTSIENVYGGRLNDRITGDAGANLLVGESFFHHPPSDGADGDDTLDGLGGNDTLRGGTGADDFVFSVAPGAANADLVEDFDSGSDQAVLDGNVHANIGASGGFLVNDERFHAAAGATTAHDTTDRVIYDTSTGNVYYDADGTGSQHAVFHVATLQGAPALAAEDIYVINGSASGQHIVGTSGDDSLKGGDGNDTLDGLGGVDTLDGGLGDDTYVVTAGDVIVNDPGGLDTVMSNASWTLGANSGLENLTLTGTAALVGQGNNFDNVINGNDGANTLNGRAGSDLIFGNGGNDVIDMSGGGTTSYGNDTIHGGSGFDTVDFVGSAALAPVTIDLGAGTGNAGAAGSFTFSSIERVFGGNFADRMTGSNLSDTFYGQGGNDTLNGAAGNDTLTGGAGNDSFLFANAPGTANADRILDFVTGTDELVFENGVMAALGGAGAWAAGDGRFWAASGATAGHDADDRLVYNTSTGNLYYDADGSGLGAAQLVFTLSGSLAASDITVI